MFDRQRYFGASQNHALGTSLQQCHCRASGEGMRGGQRIAFNVFDGWIHQRLLFFHSAQQAIQPASSEALLVEARLQRAGGGQKTHALALEEGARGVGNMQYGQTAFAQQIVVPVVGRIAGNGHSARTCTLQGVHPLYHVWQRRLAVAGDGGWAVWHLRHGIGDDGDVLLIMRGGCLLDQLLQEIHGGKRSHAAQHAQQFVFHVTIPVVVFILQMAEMKSARASITPYVTKDGSEIRELMHPAHHGNRAQSLAEATVRPGVAARLHRHLVTEEIYHVVSGRGRMTLGAEQFDVAAGDTVCIMPGVAHCIACVGDVPLKILCACAPAYAHEDTELL